MVVRLKRSSLVAAGLTVALGVTAFATAGVAVTLKSSANSALGTTIVVSSTGKTLYRYRDDTKSSARCTGACATSWPPLLVAAGKKPVAGNGLTASKLGMLKRADGKIQVTYGGYPLYFFAGDKKAGDVNGQGLEGEWHAVAPSGAIVTKAATAPAASSGSATATTTTTTSNGGSGGYSYG
jgi:predicted lipoprotein with Yx(FWY)xxD motif